MVPRREPPQRFLNRDVEHEQLKSSVKEAEVPLSLEKTGNKLRVQMEMLEVFDSWEWQKHAETH